MSIRKCIQILLTNTDKYDFYRVFAVGLIFGFLLGFSFAKILETLCQ